MTNSLIRRKTFVNLSFVHTTKTATHELFYRDIIKKSVYFYFILFVTLRGKRYCIKKEIYPWFTWPSFFLLANSIVFLYVCWWSGGSASMRVDWECGPENWWMLSEQVINHHIWWYIVTKLITLQEVITHTMLA